jgi:nitrogenase molybdenum-cofactor synthesis protein NifE
MVAVEAEIRPSFEPITAISSIRDWNYPVTVMGQVSTYSLFPLHRQVINNADDFPGIVEGAKKKVPCDIVYTTGTCTERRRRVGDQDALYSIVDQLLEDCDNDKVENSVNLIADIGFPPPRAHFSELTEILKECGITVNGIYFDSNTVSELKAIPKAELNVASGHSPFSWIELAESKFGTKTLDLAKMMYTIELDEVPYGIKGTLNLLRRIGDHFGIGGEVEAAVDRRVQETTHILDRYREKTQGIPIALGARGMPMSGSEIIMIRELGMNCKVLTFRFNTLKGVLNKSTLKWLEERVLRFLSIYQEEEPEVLIDPTVEEEIKAFKKNDVQLIVPNAHAHPGRYSRLGVPVFIDRYTKYHGFGSLGFRMPIAVAEDVSWCREKGVGKNTLLSLVEYSDAWPKFDEHWANLAELFQEVWYYEVPPEDEV